PPLLSQVTPFFAARCAALAEAGVIEGADTAAQAKSAHARMRDAGWTDEVLHAGALSTGFDLWRSVVATYASSYGRYAAGEHPCGFSAAPLDASFSARAATAAEQAAWWSDGSGIPPSPTLGIVDPNLSPPDFTLSGLQCLRALHDGDGADARRVQAGIAATHAGMPRQGLPVVVVHGVDDGLVPMAFSSAPYVAAAKAAGRDVRFWQVRNAQHFDGFLGLPDYGARYVPMLPYVYAALDRVSAHLDGEGGLPADAELATTPRGAGKPLEATHLAIPR